MPGRPRGLAGARALLLGLLLLVARAAAAGAAGGGADVEARLEALELLLRHPEATVRRAAEAAVSEASERRLGAAEEDSDDPWYVKKELGYPFVLVFLEATGLFLFVMLFEHLWLQSTLSITTARCWKSFSARVHSSASLSDKSARDADVGKSDAKGLEAATWDEQRTEQFWRDVAAGAAPSLLPGRQDGGAREETFVFFSKRQFIGKAGSCARVHVRRRGDLSQPLAITVKTLEAVSSEFAAQAGTDFDLLEQQLQFEPHQGTIALEVPLPDRQEKWVPTRWFRVELSILSGHARLAGPTAAQREDHHGPMARVYILQDVHFPPGATPDMWADRTFGFELALLYLDMQRKARGEKWRKCLISLLYWPFHSVVVSAFVKSFMLDWAANPENPDVGPANYHYILMLAGIYFLSVALSRWGDWCQTKNRGRTGGIRQTHRQDLFCKMMMLEYKEQNKVNPELWFYVALQTVDTCTVDIYWHGFKFLQSLFALICSISLAVYSATRKGNYEQRHTFCLVMLVLLMPFSVSVAWCRRWNIQFLLEKRMEGEATWVATWAWLASTGAQLFSLGAREKAAVEKKFADESKSFVSWHQQARDEVNDTTWVIRWSTSAAYCVFLVHGGIAMLQGRMQPGEFVLLLSVASSYRKYSCKVFESAVHIARGGVHLKKLCHLLNLQEHRSMQEELRQEDEDNEQGDFPAGQPMFHRLSISHVRAIEFAGSLELRTTGVRALNPMIPMRVRPGKQVAIPLGRVVRVRGGSEGLRYSVLALAAGVVSPTKGRVACPEELWAAMLPFTPVRGNHLTVLEALTTSGAKEGAAQNLALAMGLDADHKTSMLAPGELQVLAAVRVMLRDPDILVASRPLSYLLRSSRPRMEALLRLWQTGGANAILALAGGGDPADSSWEGKSVSVRMAVQAVATGGDAVSPAGTEQALGARDQNHRTLIITDEDMAPELYPKDVCLDLTEVVEDLSYHPDGMCAEGDGDGADEEDWDDTERGDDSGSGTDSDSGAEETDPGPSRRQLLRR